MDKQTSEISAFLNNYKNFLKQLERQKTIYYKSKFDNLIDGYRFVMEKVKKLERKEASRYNIFNILNISNLEKTHTSFLQNFLDPNGSHGQGRLFIDLFISLFIPSQKRKSFILDDDNYYNVIEEKVNYYGRLDIYIHSLSSEKKFGIVIENKPFARDQQNQLERYYNFLKKIQNLHFNQIMIFYLTQSGRCPSFGSGSNESYSITKETMTRLTNEDVLKCISYKKDIKEWLELAKTKVEANRVKNIITQYLCIIENLR